MKSPRKTAAILFVDDGYPESSEYANNYIEVAAPLNRDLSRAVLALLRRARGRLCGEGHPSGRRSRLRYHGPCLESSLS